MVSILLTAVLLVIAIYFGGFVRNRFKYILVASTIISIVTFFVDFDMITQGFLGLAFFIVVMYGGAFPKTSTISKRIRAVRKEYSIVGFVFLLSHAIKYLIEFLQGDYPYEWIGIIAFVIMIPLFITSFGVVKKKMKRKKWKSLQQYAYFAYLLTFIHLLIIGQEDHIPVYIAVFSIYTILKLYNFVLVNHAKVTKVLLSIVIVLVANLLIFKATNVNVLADVVPVAYTGTDYIETELIDGIYTGTSDGYKGLPVEVDVTVLNGEITEIDIIEDGSTDPKRGVDFRQAAVDIAEDILENQSTDIDTISGATSSTKGILEAVEDALE